MSPCEVMLLLLHCNVLYVICFDAVIRCGADVLLLCGVDSSHVYDW